MEGRERSSIGEIVVVLINSASLGKPPCGVESHHSILNFTVLLLTAKIYLTYLIEKKTACNSFQPGFQRVVRIAIFFLTIDSLILSRSVSDHLRCGGWLNFEFSKKGKYSGWAIRPIYKKLSRGMLKHIPLHGYQSRTSNLM